jgi:arginine/lysine/ornithine decarboxylase
MLTPQISDDELLKLRDHLLAVKKKDAIANKAPRFSPPKRKTSIREAALSPSETLPSNECLGLTLALATVACPPAVPILVCGEEIDENALKVIEYYGIKELCVIK